MWGRGASQRTGSSGGSVLTVAANVGFRAKSVVFSPVDGGPTVEWGQVQLLVRGGNLVLRGTDGADHTDTGVLTVARIGNSTWRLTGPAGTYTAVVDKRCGCRGN